MTRWLRRSALTCISLALATGACSGASPESAGATYAESRDHGFVLSISTPRQVWASTEAIDVSASLSYLGPGAKRVWGPGPGSHIGFGLIELTGHRTMGPFWLLGCGSWVMTRSPITTHYLKSGGYGIGEPDAAFYQSFLADPIFRLPPGRWKLTAYAPLTIGPEGCRGTRVDLKASITLIVQ